MSMFFVASVSVELQHDAEGLQELDQIEGDFPESSFVLAQVQAIDLPSFFSSFYS